MGQKLARSWPLFAGVILAGLVLVVSAVAVTWAGPGPGPRAASGPRSGAIGTVSPNSSVPVVELLAGYSQTVSTWNVSVALNFTVAPGVSQVIYAWAIAGNFTPYTPPVLPAGMSIAASIGFEGMASGNLTAGTYATDLNYAGYVNLISVAIYGISDGANLTYQYSSLSQLNQHQLHAQQLSLALPTGGSDYLVVESTGGTWPVNNASITQVDEQTPALRGGVSGVIGRQSGDVASFDTVASGAGIVAVAIGANATQLNGVDVNLLASFSATTGAWNLSFPLAFFVPAGTGQVLYLWALGGNYSNYTPPVLPAGMSVAASIGFEGIATGNLSSGSYVIGLSYAGWTNMVSLAVYGVSDSAAATYRFGAIDQPNPGFHTQQIDLTLPAGAAVYLGVESTGGTWPVTNASFSFVDEAAWALRGGLSGEIGRQLSNTLSFTSRASGAGIVAIGIYTNATLIDQPVTFEETGLPAGASWTLALGGSSVTTKLSSLTHLEPGGTLAYVVAGPTGYAVSGIAPSGTVQAHGSALVETVHFVKERTVTLTVDEKGLAAGRSWCVQVGGWERCSTGHSLTFPGLTPGAYPYLVVPLALHTVTARIGKTPIALAGTAQLTSGRTLALQFTNPTPVLFTETGLAPGTSWSISVKGQVVSSSTSSIVFYLSNGHYAYKIGHVAGYTKVKSMRMVVVSGDPVSVEITFLPK